MGGHVIPFLRPGVCIFLGPGVCTVYITFYCCLTKQTQKSPSSVAHRAAVSSKANHSESLHLMENVYLKA